jgi:hypothetical protein
MIDGLDNIAVIPFTGAEDDMVGLHVVSFKALSGYGTKVSEYSLLQAVNAIKIKYALINFFM